MSQEISITRDETQITYTYVGTPKFMVKGYGLYLLLCIICLVGGCSAGAAVGTALDSEIGILICIAIGLGVGFYLVKKFANKLFHKQGKLQVLLDEQMLVTNDGARIPMQQIHSIRTEQVALVGDAKGTDIRRTLVVAEMQNGSTLQLTNLMVSNTTANRIYSDLTN